MGLKRPKLGNKAYVVKAKLYTLFLGIYFYLLGVDVYALDIYDFSATDIYGKNISLDKYRGYVTLIVNVASKCGYTDNQYKGLVSLYSKLKTTNKFEIIAFPCNQFWEQEPESNEKIYDFVKKQYKVEFPMFSKVDIISRGWEKVDPLWLHIGANSSPPTWNFWKYLIDAKGHIVGFWGPQTDLEEIYPEIIKELNRTVPLKPDYIKSADDDSKNEL